MEKPFMRFEGGIWTCRSLRTDSVFIAWSKNPFNAFIVWAEVNYKRLSK